jgi:diaminopimelate decarboxylase
VGPAAVIQLQHGHFLITMNVTTTFPPSAVLPTVYALLPGSQLQCDHIDIQADEKSHKMRVQVVGVNPINNPHAVSTLANRLKALQPGASVTCHKDLSQLSVDADSIAAVSSLLMSTQSRALLDQHIQYYRLHSHPAFIPSLMIYLNTSKVDHVINVMRNFMADPVAGGAVRPPRPSGMEITGDAVPTPTASADSAPKAAPVTPEKPPVPTHRGVSSSSRSPHFKPKNVGLPSAPGLESATTGGTIGLPGAPGLESATSSNAAASSSEHAAAPQLSASPDHSPSAPLLTSVTQSQPIRTDTKWWASKRAELLSLTTRHAMANDSLYVYSLAQVRANIAALKRLSSIDRIFYACKANHNADILREIEKAGLGFECVSIQEMKFIRNLFPDLAKERLLFTPNFASKAEYEEAYWYTELVNLDNIYPLDQWPEVSTRRQVDETSSPDMFILQLLTFVFSCVSAHSLSPRQIFRGKSVLLRMDPGEGLGYHAKVQTGGARSKFGVSVDQLHSRLDKMKQLNLRVVGLHVHKGSGIHDASVWARTAAFLATLLPNFPDLKYLDLGGGLGVNYRDSDPVLDLDKLNAELGKFRESLDAGKQQLQLWLEPGRFIVANAGVLLSPVTQLKTKPGRSFIGIATGMNSLLRPALYDSYHEIVNLSKLLEKDLTKTDSTTGASYIDTTNESTHFLVDVVGPICETGDVLGHARAMPKATAEGDIILLDTVGAYGRVMSSNYNLREPALECILQE